MESQYIDSDGQLLRIDLDARNNKHYYNSQNKPHRLDGPAREDLNGDYVWLKNGKYHRIGGPVYRICLYNILVGDYYINGKKVNLYYICG